MQLRTPKRYRATQQKKRFFRSGRGLRNLVLLVLLVGAGYWLVNNPLVFRLAVEDLSRRANQQADALATRIPRPATPTVDVSNTLAAANLAYQTGDFERAIESYAQVVRGAPNDEQAYYRYALLLVITSDFGTDRARLEQALRIGDQAINADPESPYGWTVKGMALAWAGRYGEAQSYAQRALELNPTFYQARAVLAESYWRMEKRELAQSTMDETVAALRAQGSADPETIALVFRMDGYIAERALNRERAIASYELARQAAPNFSFITLELALSYFGNGQTDEAIATLKSALDANSRDTNVLFQLGRIYLNVGQNEDALITFQRCVEVDPQFASCLSWLGGLLYFSGNYAQAVVNLEAAIANGSTDPDDWLQLGRSHAAMLRCDLAIPILREGYALVLGQVEREERFANALRDCGVNMADIVNNLALPTASPTP